MPRPRRPKRRPRMLSPARSNPFGLEFGIRFRNGEEGFENALTGTLKSLFAVAEAYPELKANQSFTALQQELTNTEGFIAECRSHYNDAVLAFNNALQVVPANAVA